MRLELKVSAPDTSRDRPVQAGDLFTQEDLDHVFDLVQARQKNFKEEPALMSFALVLFNLGDRYSSVMCTDEDHLWVGMREDLIAQDAKCPEGHDCVESTRLKLGWVEIPELIEQDG